MQLSETPVHIGVDARSQAQPVHTPLDMIRVHADDWDNDVEVPTR